MSDFVEWLKTALMVVVVIGSMVAGLAVLNHWANDRNEVKCVNVGGEYYRAPEASKSLCRMPK